MDTAKAKDGKRKLQFELENEQKNRENKAKLGRKIERTSPCARKRLCSLHGVEW